MDNFLSERVQGWWKWLRAHWLHFAWWTGRWLFSTDEWLLPEFKGRSWPIRAKPNFCVMSAVPNASLGTFYCWLKLDALILRMTITRKNGHASIRSSADQTFRDSIRDFHQSCQTKSVQSRRSFWSSSSSSDCYCQE